MDCGKETGLVMWWIYGPMISSANSLIIDQAEIGPWPEKATGQSPTCETGQTTWSNARHETRQTLVTRAHAQIPDV